MLHCRFCGGQNVIRHGRDSSERQRYLCHHCGRIFREHPGTLAYSAPFREWVLVAYRERASMRGVCCVFGVGRNTLSGWLKKASRLPPLAETLSEQGHLAVSSDFKANPESYTECAYSAGG